jgi:hypothetical protein
MADILGSLLGGQGGGMDYSGSRLQPDQRHAGVIDGGLRVLDLALANRPPRSQQRDAGGRSRPR